MSFAQGGPDDVADDPSGESLRRQVAARARAEALVRGELSRWDSLRAEAAQLEATAGPARRVVAALVGSRLAGLLAGYGSAGRPDAGRSEVERRGADLRRRRFRLARRKRVLEAGAPAAPRPVWPSPRWLSELDPAELPSHGPTLRRRALATLLAAPAEQRSRPARVLLGDGCPPAASRALERLGLERAATPADADVAIVAGRDGELALDWILHGERSHATAAGLGERLRAGDATALAEALRAGARAPAFCVRIASRDWEAAGTGGDAALARSLARALGERGHQALLQVDAEADEPLAQCLDVLLVLRGRRAGEPTAGRINLIWQISHPDEADPAELDRYDRILVASRRYAEALAPAVRPPVEPLLQFADPQIFHPAPEAEPRHDVAFVGNWRGEFRRIVWDAIQTGRPPALYGRGWDLLAPEHRVAEHVPYEQLHRLYSSCRILLCDHWEDMRREGFLSNRVFEALACETFVLADDNPAIAEELPGAVETYASQPELREKLDRYLADPEARGAMARRGRELVLAEHTVERRVDRLLQIVDAMSRRSDAPAVDASEAAGPRREAGAERP